MIVFVILCFEPEKLNPVIAAYVANTILELLTRNRMEVQYIGKGLHKTNTNCRTLIKKREAHLSVQNKCVLCNTRISNCGKTKVAL